MILTGASTRNDGSLGLRFSTPELSPAEKTAIFELQNKNLKMLIQPMDGEISEIQEVKAGLDEKTPSQRLRGVLFLLWKQQTKETDLEVMSFEVYYRQYMERLIESAKNKLHQE